MTVSSTGWARSLQENATTAAASSFITLDLGDYLVLPWTVRRVIIDWDMELLNTSTSFGLPSQAPSAVGVGITTVPGSGSPPPPSAGPLSAIGDYTWWWEGAPWRPIYVPAAGNSWWGSGGRIDMSINHELDPTKTTSIWLGAELDDPTPIFASWSLTAYAQILTYTTG